jgi:hypothetical protein
MFHRRHFLKSTAAAVAALILPRSLFARTPDHFFFIHADSCNFWPVADPVLWSLKHARQPVLERAAEGLARLTVNDGERVIRVVVRRCRLNLIELQPEHVIVQHWGTQGLADIKPFFKQHRLTRQEVEIFVRDRKKEVATTQPGDDFLYGDRVAADFPLGLFESKWERRFEQDADDWTATPATSSGFAWDGVEDGRIPWAALKSAWRRAAPATCLNCDQPTILTNFGLRPVGIFNRCPNFVSVCSKCRRSFRDESVKDVAAWIEGSLDPDVWPGYEMVWGRRVKLEPKA